MSKRDSPILSRAAPYPSRAEFPLEDLSNEVHHDLEMEEPEELDSPGSYAATGAVSGAWLGWLLGLSTGVGFLILPEFALVFPKSSVLATFLAGIGGGVAGALIGVVVGALIGWTARKKDT